MRRNRIILLVIVFIASTTLGYIITRPIIKHKKNEVKPPVIIIEETNSNMNSDTIPVIVQDTIDDNSTDTVVSPDQKPVPVVKKTRPSEAALTRIINDLNNRNYPRHVTLKYENLDRENGEQPQESISNIRSYIRSGVWKSVTVTDFEYDEETGKIISITLRINRNIEE